MTFMTHANEICWCGQPKKSAFETIVDKCLFVIMLCPLICMALCDPSFEDLEERGKQPNIKPLPTPRKRALTLPLSTPNAQVGIWKKQKTKHQSQSLLFTRLNYDIRRIIYSYLLSLPDGRNVHVAFAILKKLGRQGWQGPCILGISCHSDPHDPSSHHWCWSDDGISHLTRRWPRPGLKFNPVGISLNILRSCRQIYSEAIGILYMENTFNIRQPKVLIHLPGVMIPHRLSSIRSLYIDPLRAGGLKILSSWGRIQLPYWHESCVILSKMEGLQNLQVDFRLEVTYSACDRNEGLCDLMRPLLNLRVPNFKVRAINWGLNIPKVRQFIKDSDPPFVFEEILEDRLWY